MSERSSIRKIPLAGIAVAGVLIVALVVWRSSRQEAPGSAVVAPTRGGQLVASVRSEPRGFNRLVSANQTSDLIAILTQGRLVRINRVTAVLEPWLAERWESSANGRIHTVHLRPAVTWSDGTPFTSADVLFSLAAAFDPKSGSVVADSLTVAGEPIRATAPDAHTVVLTFAGASGPGMRLLDNLTILPKHKLAGALAAGTFAQAWGATTPPSEIVGTGPFVLRDYQPGQRLVLERNPRYWRKDTGGAILPYLDRIVLQVVPEQNAELLRLQSGELDLASSELRPDDFIAARRAEAAGTLTMTEIGVATDADAFWFLLKPEKKKDDPRFAFVQRPAFRQALSHAVDREAFARSVFLGEAVPVWGPITPGNHQWFSPNVPRYPHDTAKARALLKGIGLEDRNGDGVVEDAKGTAARFTVITQSGVGSYEKGTTLLKEEAAKVGIALDVVPLEVGAMIQRMLASDYDAIYMRPIATDLDPAGNMDMWLSSGSSHFWNLEQAKPATEWEMRVDTLMLEQASALDLPRRKQLFDDVQRIIGENAPVLYFAAPRMFTAYSSRVQGVVPSVTRPTILWNADMLSVNGPSRAGK